MHALHVLHRQVHVLCRQVHVLYRQVHVLCTWMVKKLALGSWQLLLHISSPLLNSVDPLCRVYMV
jgi:hypothetical protein